MRKFIESIVLHESQLTGVKVRSNTKALVIHIKDKAVLACQSRSNDEVSRICIGVNIEQTHLGTVVGNFYKLRCWYFDLNTAESEKQRRDCRVAIDVILVVARCGTDTLCDRIRDVFRRAQSSENVQRNRIANFLVTYVDEKLNTASHVEPAGLVDWNPPNERASSCRYAGPEREGM